MIQELADDIWETEAFHTATRRLQRAWIGKETGADDIDLPNIEEVAKVIQASAVLACSDNRAHRGRAYRAATSAYELFGTDELPLHQAARVVLARLGNFPALRTRTEIAEALFDMPAGLAVEELAVSEAQTVILRDEPVVLTNFQYRLWSKLKAGKRVALTAPTSAGKSFVLQGFLASLFGTPGHRSVVYLVPTRALIAQVSRDLRQIFERSEAHSLISTEIISVPMEADQRLPLRAVYVMTQERLQLLLTAHPELSAPVIIVDEAHSISDGARGVLLQSVVESLLARQPEAQLLFASPGVKNLDVFGRLFDLPDVHEMPSNEPTVAQNFLMVSVEDQDTGRVSMQLLERGSPPLQISNFNFERRTVTRIERLVNAALAFGSGATNLVYANGSGDAEAIALSLTGRLKERVPTGRQEALARFATEAVHKSYALAMCVRRGVGFHYAHMPTQLRQAVEDAVSNGDLDYLVCTSTLLQGVNLPAKNIFMCRPEKGDKKPLHSVDFWNLAGRAGRLLREFQGNIFLIDYERWKKQPLYEAQSAVVVPAVEGAVYGKSKELVRLIGDPRARIVNDPDLEAVFVRLLDDHDAGTLRETLERFTVGEIGAAEKFDMIEEALKAAALKITMPRSVLRKSPNISAHKQQRLYTVLKRKASGSYAAAVSLIPKHPQEQGAYDSYVGMFLLCHRIILGLKRTSGFHRFIALVALWWMEGYPLPRIVQNQLDSEFNKGKNPHYVVRETLKLVENEVRYQCVRLTACYIGILEQVFIDLDMKDLTAPLPALPLFLEIGASDRTMVSLMSLGLSRIAAVALSPLAPNRSLDVEATARWLRTLPADMLRLSPLIRQEITALISSLGMLRTVH